MMQSASVRNSHSTLTEMYQLRIGFDSFKDALYWWGENEYPAFWVELNSGYYQLNPKEYEEIMLGEGYADVVYTV